MANPLAEKIRALLEPAVRGAGYELVDLEWKHEQVGWVVRVYIDVLEDDARLGHGVGLDDCTRVSREISPVLDVADVIPHAYSLEVSSPGLNRPLRSLDHFRRFIGKTARVKLKDGVAGRKNFKGTILAAAPPGEVTIEIDDGQKFVLPLADLDRANLEHDYTQGEG
jgi:ribosome maturation factor RimP